MMAGWTRIMSFRCYKIILAIILLVLGPLVINAIVVSGANELNIGVLMSSGESDLALRRTIEQINGNTNVLLSTKIVPIVEVIEADNSYQASAAICRLMAKKVWAIIGPESIQLQPIFQSITAHYHIPLIIRNWQPQTFYLQNLTRRDLQSQYQRLDNTQMSSSSSQQQQASQLNLNDVPESKNFTVNLYPVSDQLSQAYLDLVRNKGWKTLTIVYDTPEDFIYVKKIFSLSSIEASINLQNLNSRQQSDLTAPAEPTLDLTINSGVTSSVTMRNKNNHRQSRQMQHQINSNNNNNQLFVGTPYFCDYKRYTQNLSYRKLIKELNKKRADNVLLSMSLPKVCQLLMEASQMAHLSVYNDYIIANIDTHLLNFGQLGPIAANISGFTILDPAGQQVEQIMPSTTFLGKKTTEGPKKLLTTSYAMLSDSISLLAHSLDEMLRESESPNAIGAPNCDCTSSSEVWPYGELLMSKLKRFRKDSYSGDLKFDPFGQRVDFKLNYILHKGNRFKKVAEWNQIEKFADEARISEEYLGREAIKNRTLRVSVAITEPYVMRRINFTDYSGNERYEGYCIDLLKRLSKKLQFNYIISEVADGQYGKLNNGSWNGMVRELLDRQADLAIVDLTITKERQSAVDFTHPFMTLGIAIMYKRPKMEEAEMYSFLMPFSKEVWLSMWSAYLGMSLAIWLVSRLSPVEWVNPHPCYDNPNEFEMENEIHSIGASMWFNIGSLMQQGSDLAPRSPSVRALASVWYFFTLILMSSYTANFAAFLTASRMQSPIESAEDLSKQTKIDYGCKEGGSTQAFFSSSNHSIYRRMWNFMESRKHQGVFPNDNKKGISMVKKGNYAFLMESTSLEYIAHGDCELTQIGGLLDHKGYGIAMPKRSPYRAPLSKSIVELNEAGELQDLKTKWWNKSPDGKPSCTIDKESATATSELGIDKVGGVFVLLAVGVSIAIIAALMEFIWKSLKTPRDERDTIRAMLIREILRIFRCGPSSRPATNPTYDRTNSHPSVTNLNVLGQSKSEGLNQIVQSQPTSQNISNNMNNSNSQNNTNTSSQSNSNYNNNLILPNGKSVGNDDDINIMRSERHFD